MKYCSTFAVHYYSNKRSLVIALTQAIGDGCWSNSNFSSFSEMENRVKEDLWQLHKHHLLPGLPSVHAEHTIPVTIEVLD